ncbi:MAG TPA: cupin domain-containing protein [Candidatus Paceibacterota bacterium]|nr:cupin domain-containing protein [Candidatus Paceibacterota bacterium]
MDALSQALTAVSMTGAIFYRAECSTPWGFSVPALRSVAHMLAPGTERLVPYHLVTEGQALVKFDGSSILLEAGDVIIIPHGDAHTVSNGSPATLIDSAGSLGKFLAGDLRTMRLGGGGATTRFVCGYFGCERHAERLFLAGLLQVIRINVRGDKTGQWLENCFQAAVRHAAGSVSAPRAPLTAASTPAPRFDRGVASRRDSPRSMRADSADSGRTTEIAEDPASADSDVFLRIYQIVAALHGGPEDLITAPLTFDLTKLL